MVGTCGESGRGSVRSVSPVECSLAAARRGAIGSADVSGRRNRLAETTRGYRVGAPEKDVAERTTLPTHAARFRVVSSRGSEPTRRHAADGSELPSAAANALRGRGGPFEAIPTIAHIAHLTGVLAPSRNRSGRGT